MDWNSLLTHAWAFIKEWYWLPVTILYISIAVTILIENRNPTKTLAWIMVIVFLPLIGLLIYFFFGQKFNREKHFKRINKAERNLVTKRWDKMQDDIEENLHMLYDTIGAPAQIYRYLNAAKIAPLFTHNKVKMLINGEEKFPLFLQALRSAQHHIHLEYYIFEEDNIGREILSVIKEKAQSGVAVRVMVDDFGAPKINKHRKKYEAAGIQFQTFLPVHFSSLANSNYRNHCKLLIVDGQVAFMGGINISDKYINQNGQKSPGNKVFWRDTAVRIEGAAINMLQIHFYIHWLMTKGENFDINNPSYFFPKTIDTSNFSANVSFAFTMPGQDIPSAMEAIILSISLATKKIQLCTPYFIPGEQLKTALVTAVSSGVEVELIIPRKGDSLVVQKASLSFVKPLIERGVKVYLYEKGFMHAKTISIDDKVAFIGTVNLDTRSFLINFEATAVINDEALLKQMSAQFTDDVKNAVLCTMEMWNSQPWYNKAIGSVCRLMAAIL